MRERELEQQVRDLGPWFHQIDVGVLTRDVAPAPGPQPRNHPYDRWSVLKDAIPQDLIGKRVLDIGSAEGFFAFEMARRGAHVTAVDAAPNMIKRLRWVNSVLGLEVDAHVGRLEELPTERYDIVLMIGLLYHLRNPQQGLDIVAGLADTVYVETALHDSNDGLYMFLRPPVPGVHNIPKWMPTEKCVLAMLDFAGFTSVEVLGKPTVNRGIYVAQL